MKANPLALALLIACGPTAAATGNVDVYGTLSVAIELPTPLPPFPLWHNTVSDRNGVAYGLLSLGPILMGTKEDCDYALPDENGNTVFSMTQKIKLANTDGAALGLITHRFTSEPIPAAALSSPTCTITTNLPLWGNMGLAQANGNAYVVIGSVYSATTSIPDGSDITMRDNSSYTVAVYNLDGSLKWRKRLTGLRGDWSFDPIATPNPIYPYQGLNGLHHKSAVGDFLNADGNAEIRVARVRKTTTGLLYTYTFYDVETGGVLKNVSLTIK